MTIYKTIKINPNKFEIYLNYPLITSDYSAYRIITDLKNADAITVTAQRADGTAVSCIGGPDGCVLSNALYAIEGDVVLNVSISDAAGSVVTENKIYATVESGMNADAASNTASAATIAAQAAAVAEKAMTRVNNTYSTAPQQIGTWLDGMPVWRAAFKAPITDTMKIDKACSIFYDLSFVKSAERVKLVIGGFACIDNGSVIDNNTTTLDGFGRFNWDSINPNAEYISGYIDFVTEAENIKS